MDSLRNRHRRWMMCVLCLLGLLLPLLLQPAAVIAALEYNERVPLHDDFDACTGERILIDGVQHVVGRFTEDAAGHLHFGFTRNTYGIGIGQASGAVYRLIDAVSRASLEVPASGVITLTEEYQSRLLRQGESAPNDDSLIHFLSHITINANGDVAVSVEIRDAVCR
jgi:hypothetical protein